jgi:hypothetical protein
VPHAAHAIRYYWHDPIWAELTAQLLDTGLDEHSITQLRRGLLPMNDAIDALGVSMRLDALQPFLSDTRPVVRQFATETSQSLRAPGSRHSGVMACL